MPLTLADNEKLVITKQQQLKIYGMYKNSAKKLSKEIASLNLNLPSGQIKEKYLNTLVGKLEAQASVIEDAINAQTKSAMNKAASSAVNGVNKFVQELGADIVSGQASNIPTDVVERLISGQIYGGGWNYSKALWNMTESTKQGMHYVVARGIAENKSTFDIAKDLETYVNPAAQKPWDWKKVYPNAGKKQIDYNAQRLARTLIQHSFQLSLVEATKHNPFVDGFEWHSVFSHGRTCELCEQRSGTIYAKDKLPLDHPNGLCYFTAVVTKSPEEIADRLGDWVNGAQDPYLDMYALKGFGAKGPAGAVLLAGNQIKLLQAGKTLKAAAPKAPKAAPAPIAFKEKYVDALVDNPPLFKEVEDALLKNEKWKLSDFAVWAEYKPKKDGLMTDFVQKLYDHAVAKKAMTAPVGPSKMVINPYYVEVFSDDPKLFAKLEEAFVNDNIKDMNKYALFADYDGIDGTVEKFLEQLIDEVKATFKGKLLKELEDIQDSLVPLTTPQFKVTLKKSVDDAILAGTDPVQAMYNQIEWGYNYYEKGGKGSGDMFLPAMKKLEKLGAKGKGDLIDYSTWATGEMGNVIDVPNLIKNNEDMMMKLKIALDSNDALTLDSFGGLLNYKLDEGSLKQYLTALWENAKQFNPKYTPPVEGFLTTINGTQVSLSDIKDLLDNAKYIEIIQMAKKFGYTVDMDDMAEEFLEKAYKAAITVGDTFETEILDIFDYLNDISLSTKNQVEKALNIAKSKGDDVYEVLLKELKSAADFYEGTSAEDDLLQLVGKAQDLVDKSTVSKVESLEDLIENLVNINEAVGKSADVTKQMAVMNGLDPYKEVLEDLKKKELIFYGDTQKKITESIKKIENIIDEATKKAGEIPEILKGNAQMLEEIKLALEANDTYEISMLAHKLKWNGTGSKADFIQDLFNKEIVNTTIPLDEVPFLLKDNASLMLDIENALEKGDILEIEHYAYNALYYDLTKGDVTKYLKDMFEKAQAYNPKFVPKNPISKPTPAVTSSSLPIKEKKFNKLQTKWLEGNGFSPTNPPTDFAEWSHSLTSAQKTEIFKLLDLVGKPHPFQQIEEWYNTKLVKPVKAKATKPLTKAQKAAQLLADGDKFSNARKDKATWAKDTKVADTVLREVCGKVWAKATSAQRKAIYEYTTSYSKFNEPLRGYVYGSSQYLGMGKVDLETIGINYGGFSRGQVKKLINDMTDIIEKSVYKEDIWVQRGVGEQGMDKFLGVNMSDFNLSQKQMQDKLLGKVVKDGGFTSAGVAKGKGFSHKPIILNTYAPAGTKMMYAEPFSAYGSGAGKSWDGIKPQTSFGSEAEIIIQRGSEYRITKVEKTGGKWYFDMEVVGQETY